MQLRDLDQARLVYLSEGTTYSPPDHAGEGGIADYLLQECTKRFSPEEVRRTIAALLDVQHRWESLGPGERRSIKGELAPGQAFARLGPRI
jgi:hypothetical protein